MTDNTARAHDFEATAAAALTEAGTVLSHWLPDGEHDGQEYKALSPTRSDSQSDSLSINTATGQWADFATDAMGGDFISLIAYIDGCTQGEAKSRLADFLGLRCKKAVTPVTAVTPKDNGKENKPVDTANAVTACETELVTPVTPSPDDASAPETAADELPALPERFCLYDSGLYYHGSDKNGNPLPPAWICSPLRITTKTRDADGNSWGVLLEFNDADDRPHRWVMPLELLAGDGNEYRRALLSQGLQIAPGTQARQRLTEYLRTAPVKKRARCVNKTGWHGGAFVLPDFTYGETGERILLQSLHEPAAMRTAGTLEGRRDGVVRLCEGNSRLLFAVSAAFAAPLLDITGDDSGGINFQGASSTGKTTVLYAAVSVWGGPEFLQRWRATTNGLEATAQAHNDALLCLDELAQVDAREAGEVAYMLANGTGKQRAQRDGLAKSTARWRLLFLSAGEIGLAQHMSEAGKCVRPGQEVRLADIPADAGVGLGIFETLHGYRNGGALADALREAARTHYGHAARELLAALVDFDRDELREHVRDMRADFAAEMLPGNADGQARRVCDRFALIAAGGELATVRNLTGWKPGAALQAARVCFEAWLDNRGGAGAQEEKTALTQVAQFFELHGESRFTALDSNSQRVTTNRAGFKRTATGGTAEYFVLPEVWRSEVCTGIDARYVARLCVKRGLITPGNEGRPTTIQRLADLGPTRCYHFTKTIVDA